VLRWRVGAHWYAAAITVPLTIAALTLVITIATHGIAAIGADIGLGDALGYLTLGVLLFTLTEVLTWRGFILPRLQAGMSALSANLLLGLAWALWHTPAFLIVDEQQDSYPYVGFLLLTLSAAVLTGWLYNRSGGSILIAGLFHACCDATYFYTGLLHDHRLF
jgi:membrane protease YdiL (CAAX protease family)